MLERKKRDDEGVMLGEGKRSSDVHEKVSESIGEYEGCCEFYAFSGYKYGYSHMIFWKIKEKGRKKSGCTCILGRQSQVRCCTCKWGKKEKEI